MARKPPAPQFARVEFTPEQEKAWAGWAEAVRAMLVGEKLTAKQIFWILTRPDVRDDEFVRGVAPADFVGRTLAVRHLLPL